MLLLGIWLWEEGMLVLLLGIRVWDIGVLYMVAHQDVDVGRLTNDRRTHMACTPLYNDLETRLST
jgi:hypothetical protein